MSFDYFLLEQGTTGIVEKAVYKGCRRNVSSGWSSLITDQNLGVLKVGEVRAEVDCVLLHSYNSNPLGVIEAAKLTQADTKKPSGNYPYALFVLSRGQVSSGGIGGTGKGIWAIGPGGLSFDSETTCADAMYSVQSGGADLHSYADWELADHPKGSDVVALEITGSNMLTIDTSHYIVGNPEFDNAQSHVVTLHGRLNHDGKMTVCGSGKVVFANPNNSLRGGLTVSDTATAALNAGCCPGTGTVSVGAGATLQVAQSGTATLGDALTLADGAALAFNFTELETPPVLAGTGVDAGTVNVKISAPADGFPKPSSFTLTSGMDFTGKTVNLVDAPRWADSVYVRNGNIVLRVKKGTAVLVR